MAYLSFTEYEALGLTTMSEDKFNSLYSRAELTLMTATRRFYMRHDFNSDDTLRTTAFKQALAFQIEYQFRTGITTAEDKAKANAIQSQTIGRTSIGLSSSSTNSTTSASLLSIDSQEALAGTGLLYKGVAYAR